MEKISIIKGDIAYLPFHVDAIVNAANSALVPGGGVDGAINKKAGPNLAKDMLLLGGTKTGTAVYTKAYDLNADFVIHAVGPRYKDGEHGEKELLVSAYESVMKLAHKLEVNSLAIPFLSTGVYSYPLEEAISIALETVRKDNLDARVYFVAFDETTEEIAKKILEK
ncbi:macro domain-containing protein [Companilactobacillus halodurans]|uniref:Appr-1-p processing protein n=1 Tax=Companilactobacillus halodurans TaxID=2584183 RepID=A0A5P0ZNC6_9LACO|nr:macro domain-containing protein [Companilactobacillus halodurans]MQS75686.1 Appr-1-p processing protein [Companilactobacillus halodurans]MQS97666.1 Appr-1-p processing protein [Companilactobacillus halodurans]